MSRTPPQARIDESNRSLDQIRGYGDDNEVSSPIERLNRDGQGGLQIYSTTINVDIDDAEEESQVSERLDIKTIGSILLRIESSISSMGNRLAAVERSELDDTIQFQIIAVLLQFSDCFVGFFAAHIKIARPFSR